MGSILSCYYQVFWDDLVRAIKKTIMKSYIFETEETSIFAEESYTLKNYLIDCSNVLCIGSTKDKYENSILLLSRTPGPAKTMIREPVVNPSIHSHIYHCKRRKFTMRRRNLLNCCVKLHTSSLFYQLILTV